MPKEGISKLHFPNSFSTEKFLLKTNSMQGRQEFRIMEKLVEQIH
jgi:hypothetical protein